MKKKTSVIVLAVVLIIGSIFAITKLKSKDSIQLGDTDSKNTSKVEEKVKENEDSNKVSQQMNKPSEETTKVEKENSNKSEIPNKDSKKSGKKGSEISNDKVLNNNNNNNKVAKKEEKKDSNINRNKSNENIVSKDLVDSDKSQEQDNAITEENTSSDEENYNTETGSESSKKDEVKSEDKVVSIEEAIKLSTDYIKNKKNLDDWDIIALAMANNRDFAKNSIKGKEFIECKKKEIRDSFEDYSLTDCAKTIIMLNALEENPYNFEGVNLVEKTKVLVEEKGQLLNGHIWGIIALESCNAKYDVNDAIKYLYDNQNKDGGFALIAGLDESEKMPDITAMAVYAMAMINNKDPHINKAIEYIENCLKTIEKDSDYQTSESISQVVMALVSADKDIRKFTINSRTLIDELLSYVSEDGGFKHNINGKSNNIATQQGLIALMFYKNNKNLFEDLTDIIDTGDKEEVKDIILKDNDEYGSNDESKYKEHKGKIIINGCNTVVRNLKLDGDIIIDLDKSGLITLKNVEAKNINIVSKVHNKIDFDKVIVDHLTINTHENSEIIIKGNFNRIDILSKTNIEIKKGSKIEVLNNKAGAKIEKAKDVVIRNSTSSNETKSNVAKMTIIGYRRTVLSYYEFEVKEGDTVAATLKRVLNEKGISYTMKSDGGYVSSIDGQKEKDIGPLSGWKYSVNGDFPDIGIDQREVCEGDYIEFIYVNKPNDTSGIDSSEYERNKPKIIVSGVLSGQIVNKRQLHFEVTIEDNEDSNLKAIVSVNGINISGANGKYTTELKTGENEISIEVKDKDGFRNEEILYVTYKDNGTSTGGGTNPGGGSNPGGGANQGEEITIVEGKVEVILQTTNGGQLVVNNKEGETQRLKVIIYDRNNNIEYINDILIESGMKEINLFLNPSEHIGEFKLNDLNKNIKILNIK